MCNPVALTGLAAGASTGVSLYGMSQSAKAQKKAANALAMKNAADMAAQNTGFTQRAQAAGAQTTAQTQAMRDTLTNQTAIAGAMRGSQNAALDNQQATLAAENEQGAQFRGVGDQAAEALLGQTSGPQFAQAQEDWRTQAANLLNTSGMPVLGAGASDPNDPANAGTGSPVMAAALARRAAEAATNIRRYGSTVAQAGSYAAPLNLVKNAVTENATGIMPAQQAASLLRSGSDVRLLPSQVQWRNAQDYGGAASAAADQSGQNAMQLAGLQYQNTSDIANLQQANATTTAANIAAQAAEKAKFQEQMGRVISGIGNLGLQATGYYGVTPNFLKIPELR